MASPATAAVRLLTGEREPVRLATTANINVDTGGLLTIDGVVTEVGDRVLVKDQTDGSENGIRTASTGQWYRAADARTARTLQKGTTVTVQEGTANASKVFRFDTLDPIIGDTPLVITSDPFSGQPDGIRDYLDAAPYVATRTALKALDTSKDTVAILTESGREGTFVWKAGDYSTHIAADTLEGIYIKATAIAASAGAWVRQAGFLVFGANVAWFGADPSASAATNTAGIQAAIDLMSFQGGGKVRLGTGTYNLGVGLVNGGTGISTSLRRLYMKSNVSLEGEGYASCIRRGDATQAVTLSVHNVDNVQIRNLRVSGNNTTYPVTGATYDQGSAIAIESGTGTQDKAIVLDTVWIEDTPAYGIGVEYGNHRGVTLRNIFIDGTNSDGIDIKRMQNGSFVQFEAYEIVLDNIHVRNFGLNATDSFQAGIDIRAYVTATNLWVYGPWGAQASTGVRMQGGDFGTSVEGSHRSSITNVFVNRESGGLGSTNGIQVGGHNASCVNATAMGCTQNFRLEETGSGGTCQSPQVTNCKSFSASSYGFYVLSTVSGAALVSCYDENSPRGIYMLGDDCSIIAPTVKNNATAGIELTAAASNCQIIAPTYLGTSVLVDAGTSTKLVNYAGTTNVWTGTNSYNGGAFGTALTFNTNLAVAGLIHNLTFAGKDSGGNLTNYAQILTNILVGTDGAERAQVDLKTTQNGSSTTRWSYALGLFSGSATGGDKGVDTINCRGFFFNGVQVVGTRDTGWTAGTGTPVKTAFATYAGATHTAAYVQATIQALDDATRNASRRLLAIEQALTTHGLIGA